VWRGLAEKYHWHPNLVMDETPFARLWPFLWPAGVSSLPHDPGRLRAQINRRRAARGLPPVRPRGA